MSLSVQPPRTMLTSENCAVFNAEALFEVLDAHAQVRAIVWGHVHQCFDARRRGVRLLATPSTSAQFLPQADNFAVDARPPAYRRLTLHEDGTLDTEACVVAVQYNGGRTAVAAAPAGITSKFQRYSFCTVARMFAVVATLRSE